jgi:hypothetical protein
MSLKPSILVSMHIVPTENLCKKANQKYFAVGGSSKGD